MKCIPWTRCRIFAVHWFTVDFPWQASEASWTHQKPLGHTTFFNGQLLFDIPSDVAPIFERLKLDPGYWRLRIQDFGRLISNVAGKPRDVYAMRSLISKRRLYLKHLKPESVQAG